MSKYTAEQLAGWSDTRPFRRGDKLVWIPARAENHRFVSLWQRIKHAWGVITTKYDVVDWEHD